MPAIIEQALPPLRRRIRRGFFVLIGLYALLGFFMAIAVFLASGTTPKLIHVNYDSIAAAGDMRGSIVALLNPKAHSERRTDAWVRRFDAALAFEERNVTEAGEGSIAKKLRQAWDPIKTDPRKLDVGSYGQINRLLDELIRVNEHGMFSLAEQATALGRRVFFGSLIFFGVSLFFAILIADGLAIQLAQPLKRIAEVLRDDPQLDRKVKLPKPDSMEMRILTRELGALWDRVGRFQRVNIEKLEAERERLETVLTSVEDAVLVLDNEDTIIQVSEGMLQVLALAADEVVGQTWGDLPTTQENYLKLRSRLSDELPADNAMEMVVKGTKRVYAARRRQIKTPNGTEVGQVYLLHDITELRHRDRLKNEFIGVLSHELKTPLQSLGTAAELLKGRAERMDDETRMLVDTVNEDVTRIRAVANDFMQVSTVDLHSLRLKLDRLPISQLIQEWIKPFRVLARDRKVNLEFIKEGSETIWARADAIKLPWAISNLLANAIRVSEPGTTVTVYMTDRSDQAEIEIRDDGPGIPESVQSHMFEPYYQGPTSGPGASTGFLGLGLTIAKEVVEAHGGRIDYFARRPHGSTFRISIPYEIVYGGQPS